MSVCGWANGLSQSTGGVCGDISCFLPLLTAQTVQEGEGGGRDERKKCFGEGAGPPVPSIQPPCVPINPQCTRGRGARVGGLERGCHPEVGVLSVK